MTLCLIVLGKSCLVSVIIMYIYIRNGMPFNKFNQIYKVDISCIIRALEVTHIVNCPIVHLVFKLHNGI